MNINEEIKQCTQFISARLRAARRARGFKSRTAFALACKIPLATYRTHEAGEIEMRTTDVIRYAKMLNISLEWLITGQGSPFDHYKQPPTHQEKDDIDEYLQIAMFRTLRAEKEAKDSLKKKIKNDTSSFKT